MNRANNSAEENSIVSRNRVTEVVRIQLHTAVIVERRFTVEQISELSGIKVRAIRSYMANDPEEIREPSLSNALSLAVVLGKKSVNAVLALIGYHAEPLEEAEALSPTIIAATALSDLTVIVNAAADGRIDHKEEPMTTAAADHLIATIWPLSSHRDAA